MILSEPGPIPQAPVGQFCRHNLSPRGDGNCPGRSMSNCIGDTTYPREGTETCGASGGQAVCRTQLIPARGRKLRIWWKSSPFPERHNLSPRGDGNSSKLQPVFSKSRHNLSPRGDGNAGGVVYDRAFLETQLIPARGRKLRECIYFCVASRHNLSPRGDGNCRHQPRRTGLPDTTYPREGTETFSITFPSAGFMTQLIPARGRKQISADPHQLHDMTQLIPARGRKLTSALLFCLCCRT